MIAVYLPCSELLAVVPSPDHQEGAGFDPLGVAGGVGAVREA